MIRSDYLTPYAAARLVGISRAAFLRVAAASDLKPRKLPGITGRTYYRRADVENLLVRFDTGEAAAELAGVGVNL